MTNETDIAVVSSASREITGVVATLPADCRKVIREVSEDGFGYTVQVVRETRSFWRIGFITP